MLACDLTGPDPTAIARLVDALGDADVAAPLARRSPRAAARRVPPAGRARRWPPRSPRASGHPTAPCGRWTVVEVVGLPAQALADADRPEDLPRS